MCEKHGITHIETLTGFKYIGQIMDDLESKSQSDRFLLGAEESFGYLTGTHAKDKDAIIISVVLAKAAELAKRNHQTLWDRLLFIYATYGICAEETFTLEFPPGTRQNEIIAKLAPLFASTPQQIYGENVIKTINYQNQEIKIEGQSLHSTQLPKTEALGLFTQNGWMIIRPSGTEPKLKIYGGLTLKAEHDTAKQKLLF